MGQRTYQRILDCAVCNQTPEDGEPLWDMGGEYWCEKCCNDDHEDKEEAAQ
jgi:hypothetical protein